MLRLRTCVLQRRQGLSTGLASSVRSSRTATLTRNRKATQARNRKATQTRTVREAKHRWLYNPRRKQRVCCNRDKAQKSVPGRNDTLQQERHDSSAGSAGAGRTATRIASETALRMRTALAVGTDPGAPARFRTGRSSACAAPHRRRCARSRGARQQRRAQAYARARRRGDARSRGLLQQRRARTQGLAGGATPAAAVAASARAGSRRRCRGQGRSALQQRLARAQGLADGVVVGAAVAGRPVPDVGVVEAARLLEVALTLLHVEVAHLHRTRFRVGYCCGNLSM